MSSSDYLQNTVQCYVNLNGKFIKCFELNHQAKAVILCALLCCAVHTMLIPDKIIPIN